MKGKAIELVTPIRLCLFISTFILFSCKNEVGCDLSIVPTWSLSATCEISQGDTLYIIDTEVFPLCRFSKYKVSFQDEWVDIESKIRLTADEIRMNGPDFRCSIEMKDKSIQSNMMDFNYLLQLNDGNCKLSTETILADNSNDEVITREVSNTAANAKTSEAAKEISFKSKNEIPKGQNAYTTPQVQTTKEPSIVIKKEETIADVAQAPKPRIQSNATIETNNIGNATKPIKNTAQTYPKEEETKTPDPKVTASNPNFIKSETRTTPPKTVEKETINSSTKTSASITTRQREPAKTNTETIIQTPPINRVSSSQGASTVSEEAPKISKAKPPSTPAIVTEVKTHTQENQKIIEAPDPTDQARVPKEQKDQSTIVSASQKNQGELIKREEFGKEFSPTKYPTIALNTDCESSRYESGPFSFTIVPKVRMRLNKLTLYSNQESSIDISISGGYNGLLKNRVLLPGGKSEVGMSGFSTILQPGKTYTLKISSSNSEKLSLKDISLCSKDEENGPYLNLSGSALNIISELKIDIE